MTSLGEQLTGECSDNMPRYVLKVIECKKTGIQWRGWRATRIPVSCYPKEMTLEGKSSAQLDGSRSPGAGDCASTNDACSGGGAGLTKVRMIERIERIRADFEFDAFKYLESLAQAEIQIAPVRSDDFVPALVAKGACRRRGKCAGVVPFADRRMGDGRAARLVREPRVAAPAGLVHARAANVRAVGRGCRSQGNSTVNLVHAGCAPAAKDFVRNPAQRNRLAFSERQFVGNRAVD